MFHSESRLPLTGFRRSEEGDPHTLLSRPSQPVSDSPMLPACLSSALRLGLDHPASLLPQTCP